MQPELSEQQKEKIIDDYLKKMDGKKVFDFHSLFSRMPWNRLKNKSLVERINSAFFGFAIYLIAFLFTKLVPEIENLFLFIFLMSIINGFPMLVGMLVMPVLLIMPVYPFLFFFLFKVSPKSIYLYFILNIFAGLIMAGIVYLGALGLEGFSVLP